MSKLYFVNSFLIKWRALCPGRAKIVTAILKTRFFPAACLWRHWMGCEMSFVLSR